MGVRDANGEALGRHRVRADVVSTAAAQVCVTCIVVRAHLILGKFTYYHYKPSYIFLGSSGFSDSLNIYLNPRESC